MSVRVEAWRAALHGPPRSFALDGEAFPVTGSWSCLLDRLRFEAWQRDVLYDLVDDASAGYLDDRLDDPGDSLTLRQMRRVAEGLVEAATGRRWWVAQKLIASVADQWADLDGALLLRGVDLAALAAESPARVCNLMHGLLVEGRDTRERDVFDFKLRQPPPWVDVRQVEIMSAEEQGAAYMAAMGGVRRGGPVSGP
ncbi:hypothetical protein AB0F17_28800 [Nonomuraea sp. NPDC026600]|uniref:hypothetical protein n=1 Tax=Nonomuraea sp. NPDC026600 TaxID=3155363 RepID=UPI0033D40F6B